jgi:lipoprotein-anchoring transpeptidase ErfK/SrfK
MNGGGNPAGRPAGAHRRAGRWSLGLRSWTFVAVLAAGGAIGGPLLTVAAGPDPVPPPVGVAAASPASAFASSASGAGTASVRRSPTIAAEPEPQRTTERAQPPRPHLLVHVPHDLPLTARPGEGAIVGVVPDGSRFYDVPTVAWVQEVSEDGRFGRLAVPYAPGNRSGWLRLGGLQRRATWVEVHVDLSERVLRVYRRDRLMLRARTAIGAPATPTPRGRYFVTDRVPFPAGDVLGRFAFGISGIQPNLPAGWSGGDQLAIHGTNVPSSIGRSASAGCLRVAERILDRLKPLLRLGTPVIVRP